MHWWVPPHPQPARTQLIYTSCQVPHGNPHFYFAGSSQRLVDGIAGSQGHLSSCADTPQSLAVSSVCSQEPGMGAHCLSMESSPYWLSHCPQSFYETLGSSSSTLASAGMSDVSVHRRHFPASQPASTFSSQSANQTARTRDISLHCHFKLGFIINLMKSALVPSRVMLHLGALIDTARGLIFKFPAWTEMIIHATRALLDLTQVSALCLSQVTGLLAFCHALGPLYMFLLHPLSNLLRDHFNMREDRTSKLIPCHLQWSGQLWNFGHAGILSGSPHGWRAVCSPLPARGVSSD